MQKKLLNLLVTAFLLVMLITVTVFADGTVIAVEDGKLTGIDANVTYEYQKLASPNFTIGEYAVYDAETSVLENGLYAVRATGDEDFQYVLAKGANAGTLTWARQSPVEDDVPGTWEIKSPLGSLAISTPYYANSKPYGFANQIKIASQDKFNAGAYTYTLADDELISVLDVSSFTFTRKYNQGDHVRSIDPDGGTPNVTGAVVFHVVGGTVDSYSIPFTWTVNTEFTQKASLAAVAGDDPEGYIYQIQIYLIDTSSTGIEITDNASYLEALTALNLRPAKEGNGYNELKGGTYSITADEYLYHKSVADYPSGRKYVGSGGEFVLDVNGEKIVYTSEYTLNEGEFITLHYVLEDGTIDNTKLGASVSYLDATPYVMTGCAAATGKTGVYEDDYTYQMLQFTFDSNNRIPLALRVKEDMPSVTVEGTDTKGVYRISGFNAEKSYSISADGKVFTTIPAGVTSYEVTGMGTYYIYTNPDLGNVVSDTLELVINGEMPEAQLSYDETSKSIVGFDYVPEGYESVTYQYGKIYPHGIEWLGTLESGEGVTLPVEYGYYAFRIAPQGEGYVPSSPSKIFVYEGGTNKGRASHDYAANTSDLFVEGKWSRSLAGSRIYYDKGAGGRLATSVTPTLEIAGVLSWRYAFAQDEIFPLNEASAITINSIGFAASNPYSLAYTPYARIYVADGEADYYDVKLTVNNTKVDLAAYWTSIPPKGYVIAVEFFYFSPETLPNLTLTKPGDNYPVFRINGMSYTDAGLLSTCTEDFATLVDPVLTLSGSYKTTYAVGDELNTAGLTANMTYLGTKSCDVTSEAVVSVPDLSTVGTKTVTVTWGEYTVSYDIVVKGKREALDTLSFSNGVVTGFDSAVNYEYRVLNVNDVEWTAIESGTESITLDGAGVWAVRIAEDDNYVASPSQFFTIKTDNYGTIAWGKFDKTTSGFSQGCWTNYYKNIYADKYTVYGVASLRHASGWTANYDTRHNHVYQYAMANDEVIKVTELTIPVVRIGFGAANPLGSKPATSRLRIYVAEGDVPYYDVDVDYTPVRFATVNYPYDEVIPEDAKGYVTAIQIYPVWDMSDPSAITANENRYPVMDMEVFVVEGNEELEQTDPERCRVLICSAKAPKELYLAVDESSSDYLNNCVIKGFDPDKSYEYYLGSGEVIPLPAGTTELPVSEGVISIRYAAGDSIIPSEYVNFEVKSAVPVFGSSAQTDWLANVTTADFVEGKWASYPSNLSEGESRVTTHINYMHKLSDVSYKYQFTEDRYFKVDDYPWFSIDFNNELLNMGMPKAYIEGAVAAIDVYVVGEDEPYTLTTEWKGATVTNYYTPNAYKVNLLALFPELEGKTVYKFNIRPYSNLDTTPNDYNTEASANRYMYFRLIHVGFFDTASNVSAVAKGDGLRVNSFEGIEITGNSTYYIGDELNYTLSEVYSDGTKNAVDGVLTLPEGFADTIGTHTLSVEWRGKSATLDVEVKAVELVSIAVNSWPAHEISKTYYEGDPVDLTGLTIKANYNNGKTEIIELADFKATYAAETMTPGTVMSIEYGGKKISGFVLTVKSLDAITVKAPDKTEYFVGETYTNDGVKVEAVYSDGKTVDVTADAVIGTADTAEAGTKTVNVTYKGRTASFDVTVKAVEVDSITVTSPDKTTYFVGEELVLDGMTVTAKYNNGTENTVDAYTVDPAVLNTVGTVTVTVTYEGKTATFNVTVKKAPSVLESITVIAPAKTEYTVGDTLDTMGMIVIANYIDGTTADVTEYTVDTTVLDTVGIITVTVTYNGMTDTFNVTVSEAGEPEDPENVASGSLGNIDWIVDTEGVLNISGNGEMADYTRTATAPWTAYSSIITSIVVEDGVTSIGNYAFYNLINAKEITVSESVKYVGTQFIRRTAIKEIELPGLETLGNACFSATTNLETVILTESVKDVHGNVFQNTPITVKAPENSYAAKYAQYYKERYESDNVTFEANGVAEVPVLYFGFAGDNAFYAIYEIEENNWHYEISGKGRMKNFPYICQETIDLGYRFTPTYYLENGVEKNITTLALRDGLTTLGNTIFYKCTKATSVTLPQGITSVGQSVFWVCAKLSEIVIPEGVTTIGTAAFNGCVSLKTLYIPASVTTVAPGIFIKCNTANITVYTESPAAVATIRAEYPDVNIVTTLDYQTPVFTAEELISAIASGENAVLMNDLKFTCDAPIVVAEGMSPVLNLNGFELQINTYSAEDHEIFTVNGELTVENGSIYVRHQSGNMGSAHSTIGFHVADGGVLNLENATVENRGGTDVNYAILLDNQGDVTLNANGSSIVARYCAIAITGSGEGMNTVSLSESTVSASSRPIWIKGCKDLKDAKLELGIFDETVSVIATKEGAKAVIFCGTEDLRYFDADGNEYAHDDTWDTTVDTSWYDENATEHILRTAEQLAGFAQLVSEGNTFEGETVTLLANINFRLQTWTPIGAGAEFRGTFNGSGKTVKNITISAYDDTEYGVGLFGVLGTGASIENLTVTNAVTNGGKAVGVIAGCVTGDDVVFSNVHVVNASVTASSEAGALVGTAYGDIIAYACTTTGTVSGTRSLGGLIGLVKDGTTVTVIDCETSVEFTLSDNRNGGMYVTFRDGASMLMYVTADGIVYYAASADMYCYEASESDCNEYLAGLGLTATLDALVCNN